MRLSKKSFLSRDIRKSIKNQISTKKKSLDTTENFGSSVNVIPLDSAEATQIDPTKNSSLDPVKEDSNTL